jgi:DNA-binding MarR family transcriptional regulator
MSEPASAAPGLHSALVRNTGYLVSRLGVFASRHFSERLEILKLTPRMWGALNVLDAEGPITQQQLGRSIGMDPSSMVSTIDELESQGLVQRQPHPSDRRAHAVHVTPSGRQTLQRGRALARDAQDELLAPLDADERHQLHGLLLRLAIGAGTLSSAPAVTSPPASSTRPD